MGGVLASSGMICEGLIASVNAVAMASTSGVKFLSLTLVITVTMASVSGIMLTSFALASVTFLRPVFNFSLDKKKNLP